LQEEFAKRRYIVDVWMPASLSSPHGKDEDGKTLYENIRADLKLEYPDVVQMIITHTLAGAAIKLLTLRKTQPTGR
jgi:CO dehydrogenase/acetyl-CoA synthase alpha subunit